MDDLKHFNMAFEHFPKDAELKTVYRLTYVTVFNNKEHRCVEWVEERESLDARIAHHRKQGRSVFRYQKFNLESTAVCL